MTKVKITIEIEYNLNPRNYPKGLTPEECLKLDEDNDAHYGFVETGDFEVKYELVEEGK